MVAWHVYSFEDSATGPYATIYICCLCLMRHNTSWDSRWWTILLHFYSHNNGIHYLAHKQMGFIKKSNWEKLVCLALDIYFIELIRTSSTRFGVKQERVKWKGSAYQAIYKMMQPYRCGQNFFDCFHSSKCHFPEWEFLGMYMISFL